MNRWHLPSRTAALTLVAVLTATLLGACSAGAPTPSPDDPYAILAKSLEASYDPVRVQVGLKTSGGSPNITIEPEAIEIVVDEKAGAGTFHMSLPTDALSMTASDLAPLGITGDTLDLDLAFDASGVYAKSPLAAALIPMLTAQTGQTVSGDLNGWLRLATADDLASLVTAMGQLPGASPAPSAAAPENLDAAGLRKQLEDSGITLAYGGSEQRNGAESRHVTMAIDLQAILASEAGKQMPAAQRAQLEAAAGMASVKADLWFNAASGALAEIVIEVLAEGSQGAQVTIRISDPGAVSIEVPATYSEVPLVQMLLPFMQLFGGGLPSS